MILRSQCGEMDEFIWCFTRYVTGIDGWRRGLSVLVAAAGPVMGIGIMSMYGRVHCLSCHSLRKIGRMWTMMRELRITEGRLIDLISHAQS